MHMYFCTLNMLNLIKFVIVEHVILSWVFGIGDAAVLAQRQFHTLHKWSHSMELTFPSENVRDLAIKEGFFDINRIQLPVDIEVEYRENDGHRIFLTIPRLNFGVPYSLATISENDRHRVLNPTVTAYPNYEWHQGHGSNCTAMTSALRIFIDECQRLWVIDSGQISSLQWCSPQLLTFDLQTNQLLQRYVLPSNNYKAGISVYTDMLADVQSPTQCQNTKIYISDAWGHGLIVYDMQRNKSWRIEHDLMKPDRTLINNAHDGIFAIGLSPRNTRLEERYLYFHSLNSFHEIRIPLRYINNASIWYYPKENTPLIEKFTVLGSRGTQCESQTMDLYGNLYCSIIGSNALVRWKEGNLYTADNLNVVAYGPRQWRFVTGLKLATNHYNEQELWALSTEPKLFVGKPLQGDRLMYQIFGCRLRNLLRNELCSVAINE